MFDEDGRDSVADCRSEGPDLAAGDEHVAGHRIPLGPPHPLEAVEGGVEGPLHERPGRIDRLLRRRRFDEDPGEGQEGVGRLRHREIVAGTEVLELVEVGGELGLIDATGGRCERAGEVERHLHRPAPDALADDRLDPRF